MRKIINGKLYDSDTAKSIGSDSYSNPRDFNYWCEVLYQKRTGEFFLFGEGGPMSRYSRSMGDNSWSGGEQIIPLSYDKARKWAEEHLTVDEYEAAFGLPDENAEDVVLYAKIPAALMARLKEKAMTEKKSITETVTDILLRAL